jgi:NADH dehydrogenase FAD-containing subunit
MAGNRLVVRGGGFGGLDVAADVARQPSRAIDLDRRRARR